MGIKPEKLWGADPRRPTASISTPYSNSSNALEPQFYSSSGDRPSSGRFARITLLLLLVAPALFLTVSVAV